MHERLRRLLRVRVAGDLEVERGGLRWLLTPSDHVQADVFWFGAKNTWETHHLLRFLAPGWVVLDLGANIGYYSLIIVQHLNRDCSVYAFEPCPATFARLRENIRLNSMERWVEAVPMAVSDQSGTGSVTEISGCSGENYVSTSGGDIPLTSVDEFCGSRGVGGVDLIKLDVEGFEGLALLGAKATIAESMPMLLVEINEKTLRRTGWSADLLIGHLTGLGYSLFVPQRTRLVPLQRPPGSGEYVNVFCLAAKHLATDAARCSIG